MDGDEDYFTIEPQTCWFTWIRSSILGMFIVEKEKKKKTERRRVRAIGIE